VRAVELTGGAVDDLRRAGPVQAPRLLDALRSLAADDDPGDLLVAGDTGFRMLATDGGTRRFEYRLAPGAGGRATVWAIVVAGVRSDGAAYAETLARMQAADPPELVQAARLLARLGRETGTPVVPRERRRDPVPDWLADRLVREAGTTRIAVAAMDAATAFAAWNRFLTDPVIRAGEDLTA
jgi:mRNA interferase RelE/StbE